MGSRRNAANEGLARSAEAIHLFIESCEALEGKVGERVIAEHLQMTLRRLRALGDDLARRAARPANHDAVFVALGVGSAGLRSLADAFAEMHKRYQATMPQQEPVVANLPEDPNEAPLEEEPRARKPL